MTVGWSFDEMGDKAEQNADLLTKHAFENDIQTFVRETLQNANDAKVDGVDSAVEVYYRFQTLSGSDLKTFLEELDWKPETDEVGLYDHLAAAGEVEDDRQLAQYLEHVEEKGELLLVSVEDRNTEGLDGTETEDGTNYTALIRDMGRSNKDATEGGSHGVGKTVLWAFSGLSTVLFSSTPLRDTDAHEAPRFVGRTLLPDHRDKDTDQLYSGNGWYGQRDRDDPEGRYVSMWGDDARDRASALHTEHATDDEATGTTATVVGFRDPTAESYADVDELLKTFKTSVAEYFWPAIERGLLEVHLQAPGDDDPTKINPETVNSVEPFIECFRNRTTPDDDLDGRDKVVAGALQFDLPNKKTGEDKQTEPTGHLDVYAKSPGLGEDETRKNQVAIFRGAGMVVDYIDMSGAAAYGSEFYGVLAAGRARSWGREDEDIADEQVEELLRTSEPAAHDAWKGYKNSRLQSTYEWGCAGTVESLTSKKLRHVLQNLVSTEVSEEGGLIDSMKRKIPRSETSGSTSTSSTPSVQASDAFDVSVDFTYEGGAWTFDGGIAPEADAFDEWSVTLEIVTLGEEDNLTGRLDIETAAITNDQGQVDVADGIATITGTESTVGVAVSGTSTSLGGFDPYSGHLGKTRLQIDGNVSVGGDD